MCLLACVPMNECLQQAVEFVQQPLSQVYGCEILLMIVSPSPIPRDATGEIKQHASVWKPNPELMDQDACPQVSTGQKLVLTGGFCSLLKVWLVDAAKLNKCSFLDANQK